MRTNETDYELPPLMSRAEEAGREIIRFACKLAIHLADAYPNEDTTIVAKAVETAIDQCDGIDDEEAVEATAMAYLSGHDPETRS
jgi:hypothetical protein